MRRTNLYPHKVSIFMRLACQMCVSNQSLSPSYDTMCVSHVSELPWWGDDFDASTMPPYEESP